MQLEDLLNKKKLYEGIKEILENVKKCCEIMKDQSFVVYQKTDILKLLDYIQQKENIIKEVREYIKENSIYYPTSDGCQWVDQFKVLEILDKENKYGIS